MNVLAIDQGTSATKAMVVGPGARCSAAARSPSDPSVRADGVEPDSEELFDSVLPAGRHALAEAGAPAQRSRWPIRARPCWPGTATPAGR